MSQRFYLPQIDGLRFVAFFLVLLHHFGVAEDFFPKDSWLGAVLTKMNFFGWIGVDIFLVVSSFLIVTLLTLERQQAGTISIRNFYIRRAFRIWPLYFGYVILAMVLLPLVLTPLQPQGETLRWHLFPFLTFTGNFSYAYFPSAHFAPHMWTISLEEQFYLAVPVLVLFAPALGKSIRWWALGLFVLTAAFRLYVQLNQIKYPMVWVLTPCRMDPFIVGAFCSWVYVSRREWLDRRIGWMLALAGIAGFVLVAQFARLGPSVDVVWQLTVVALSAGCLLLSTVARAGTGPLMSWKPFVFLGKISFGLYVYHWIAITLQYRYLPVSTFGTTPFAWLLTLLIVFGAITLVSVLSYYGYERPFVRLKENYERVKSRPA